jgi:hypothetical protein
MFAVVVFASSTQTIWWIAGAPTCVAVTKSHSQADRFQPACQSPHRRHNAAMRPDEVDDGGQLAV